jgi:hypothetical protein
MAENENTEAPIEDGRRLCPSSSAEEGALLIGVVQGDGAVGIFGSPLPVDADFLEAARKGRAPEKRFRFAAPCVTSNCRQWSNGHCGVIDKVVNILSPEVPDLRSCGIRAECRWFNQVGAKACAACPTVITDTRE